MKTNIRKIGNEVVKTDRKIEISWKQNRFLKTNRYIFLVLFFSFSLSFSLVDTVSALTWNSTGGINQGSDGTSTYFAFDNNDDGNVLSYGTVTTDNGQVFQYEVVVLIAIGLNTGGFKNSFYIDAAGNADFYTTLDGNNDVAEIEINFFDNGTYTHNATGGTGTAADVAFGIVAPYSDPSLTINRDEIYDIDFNGTGDVEVDDPDNQLESDTPESGFDYAYSTVANLNAGDATYNLNLPASDTFRIRRGTGDNYNRSVIGFDDRSLPIPEPSSAMMLIFSLATLLLRRKR